MLAAVSSPAVELARAIRSAYELAVEPLEIDAREFHIYSADWTPEQVSFEVDGDPVKTVRQSPVYPMQLMLGIYEFPGENEERVPEAYPKEFVGLRTRLPHRRRVSLERGGACPPTSPLRDR